MAEPDVHPPCCTACEGSGTTVEGPCWDCRGTGHPHSQDYVHDCEKCHMKPGSETARMQGCICPILDNGRGHKDPAYMVMVVDCPVHPLK